ncbi:complement C1q tumor necrosis factor-related protein 3-like [Mytilus edulis]|uniref:complement C1q tumor necrosis factor-related protein 3-like n=1 Tax=Mytilus edulis TaxID=6550 RepID=UPI0039F0656C
MNVHVFVYGICLVLTLIQHEGVEARSCTNLENKIFNNLLDMMVDIKSKCQTSGGHIEQGGPAFTATLRQHFSLTKDAAIKFDTVLLNRGGGYNPNTGIFTASKKGLYQFSATIMSKGGIQVFCYINKNGKKLMNLYGPKIHGASETASPVLELNKGDQVSVNGYYSEQVHGSHYSYFSGVYISA